MPDSLILEWLDENALRRYPLQPSPASFALPTNLLLDAQITYRSNTVTMPATVGLASITKSGNEFTVTLTGTGQTSFTVTADNNTVFPLYVRNSDGSLLVFGPGLLTVSSGTTNYSGVLFEPCTMMHIDSGWAGLTGIGINTDDLLTGTIVLQEGTQTGLSVSGKNIRMSADRNSGLPVDCSDFFAEPAMQHDCDDGVATINGVGIRNQGDDFIIEAGNMVSVFPDNENHRIYIGLSFAPEDVCPTIFPVKHGEPA